MSSLQSFMHIFDLDFSSAMHSPFPSICHDKSAPLFALNGEILEDAFPHSRIGPKSDRKPKKRSRQTDIDGTLPMNGSCAFRNLTLNLVVTKCLVWLRRLLTFLRPSWVIINDESQTFLLHYRSFDDH